jgi:sugar O-acyltransferase (sialic acid O-acetyltransferase NeuD family)
LVVKRVLIAGAGGFGRALAEAISGLPELKLFGFLDDRWPDLPAVGKFPVLGTIKDLAGQRLLADAVVIAIGHNVSRKAVFELAQAAGFELPNVIHPRAYLAHDVVLGHGVTVMAGAIVGCNSALGDGCLINAGAVLDHDCRVERFAHAGIASSMGGGATLASGALLRQGEVLAAGRTRDVQAD